MMSHKGKSALDILGRPEGRPLKACTLSAISGSNLYFDRCHFCSRIDITSASTTAALIQINAAEVIEVLTGVIFARELT
jgi:hypothetical protein